MRVISSSVPLPGQIWAVLFFGGISTAMVVSAAQDYASGRASAIVFAPLAAVVTLLMTVAYRLVRLSFRADASGLVIRNVLTTRRLPLAQITGFDVDQRFFLLALLRAGHHSIRDLPDQHLRARNQPVPKRPL